MKRYIAGRKNKDGSVVWFDCQAFRANNKKAALESFNKAYKGFNCNLIKEA